MLGAEKSAEAVNLESACEDHQAWEEMDETMLAQTETEKPFFDCLFNRNMNSEQKKGPNVTIIDASRSLYGGAGGSGLASSLKEALGQVESKPDPPP